MVSELTAGLLSRWQECAAARRAAAVPAASKAKPAPIEKVAYFDESIVDSAPEVVGEATVTYSDLPRHERIRNFRDRRARESKGPNLKPLQKWFHSKIGQPWNTVWSELCAHPQLKRLRDYGQDFVPPLADKSAPRWTALYRDEADIVRLRPRQPEPKRPSGPWWVSLPTAKIAVKVKGIWYAFTVRIADEEIFGERHYSSESFLGKIGEYFVEVRNGRTLAQDSFVTYRIIGKRQLGKAELKKFGLR